jgi:hypothetical protein
MSERDFKAGGREFKLSKLDAFKQFHIVRRLGPILGDIIPVAQKLKGIKEEGQSEEEKFETIAQLAKPIMEGLSKLSDQDANIVLLGLLSSVEVKQQPANNWARIARDGNLMIQDMELPVMLQVAGRAFAYNLAGFFAIAPQTSHGGK